MSNSYGCLKRLGNIGLKQPRIPYCHAGGRGFESRRPRKKGQIAQSVEHLSEKQGVGSSILPLATINIGSIGLHK